MSPDFLRLNWELPWDSCSNSMTMKMQEISREQASKIALEALFYPVEETDRVSAVSDEGFFWMVTVKPLEERGYSPDGDQYSVWVDQRTGNIKRIQNA